MSAPTEPVLPLADPDAPAEGAGPGDAADPAARVGESAPPRGDRRQYRTAARQRREQQWLAGVARPVFSGGNQVTLLQNGDQLFPAMHEAIRRAHHEIWLATYIFHDDDIAMALVDALVAASHRGVRVRVVVDGFGSKATLDHLRERFCAPRPDGQGHVVALAVFRPLHGWWSWLQPGQLRRLHQKLFVVDGEVAFVGGINIIDDRLDLRHGRTELPRLDFAVELRGAVVAPIEQSVRALWTRAWLGRDLRDEFRTLLRSNEPVQQLRRLVRQLRLPRGGLQASAEVQPPRLAAFVLRDNLRQRRTIERSYIAALRGARDRVDLVCPYFYPGQAFRRALRDAAKRGVKVRLLLQGKLDYRIAGLAARALYDEMLGHGVRIFEYMPAYLHAKVALVDQDWATVGSSNIDPLSLLLNLEANVLVSDAGFNAELGRCFETALADSREIDPASMRQQGLTGPLRRAIVAWGAYVYLRMAGATGRY